ncbi:SdiA-regulated domain-containing protein [Dyadobacter sp. Leaf189]|uniref:SdiA-regulated domain-containing protein n=1 Tax=Dyadobacter sp. Leaf189 TaxID=1736295 RepID=UPI0006FA7DDE|nr:SdiA-regulated domain-containing protein [Dyadobacter sp. Leaf189]KQS34035.1 SdiA-regulated family protein [Dyadobacter sp. Leaf189]
MQLTVFSFLPSLLKPAIILLLLVSCNASEKKEVRTGDYDLANPDRFNMPESLFEISGIALRNGSSDTVYAVQDEEGKVFRLGWDVSRQVHTKFSKKGDYEDISILGDTIFVLKSNGVIYNFPIAECTFEEAENVRELKGVLPKGEYEGMFADEESGRLFVLCKNCPGDDSKTAVTGYTLDTRKNFASTTFSINVNEIAAIHGKVARGFRPSALARNPVTGEWYILSAVNKLLVTTDANWKVKDAFPLDGNIFIQPEGIAFDKQGSLYISNEGDDLFSGNILKFKRISH